MLLLFQLADIIFWLADVGKTKKGLLRFALLAIFWLGQIDKERVLEIINRLAQCRARAKEKKQVSTNFTSYTVQAFQTLHCANVSIAMYSWRIC